MTFTGTVAVSGPAGVATVATTEPLPTRPEAVYVVDARGRRVRDAAVTVFLYRNGKLYARAGGRTVAGRTSFTRPASWGTYRAVVKRVSATGLRWNGKTPPNRFVRPKPR